ncbi:hypothetical protein M378DRAFT_16183 [Amanita muscaria Koide BX008]|uniref:Uncharacterized protein n=1 Tax=Amanita muscaria (strain Koide BX008) TaxID=946122 RepID=A0A0C2SU65_AMAMK|nr:hypothetical protein M378DRAFT_16183 [Amanita muscaria Koide BX008]
MNVDICSFGIEPNMLHLDPTKYQQQSFADVQYPYLSASPGDLLSSHYPFSFQAALDQAPMYSSSSSSISSRSPSISPASPSLETDRLSVPSNPQTKSQATAASSAVSIAPSATQVAQETAEELAQRVRQTVGVMLAVPTATRLAGHPSANIPLHYANQSLSSGDWSNYGSNVVITPQDEPYDYRASVPTNLNARIQSLRMAVPALRVLEDRDSSEGQKIKRAVKGGIMVKGLPGATGIVSPGEDGTPQPQKYLLATFALFSFFNSPLTQSYSSRRPILVQVTITIDGQALFLTTHLWPSQVSSWGFNEYSQAFQLVFSVLVLLSMVMSWLRVEVAPQGTSKSWLRRIRSKLLEINKSSGTDRHKNWLKVGGEMVLKEVSSRSGTLSLYTCFQVGRAVSASKSSPSLEDLCTFSLVLHETGSFIVNALLRGSSRVMWDRAKVLCASLLRKPGKHVRMYERLVLDNIDVDEAATRLAGNVIIPAQQGLDMDQEPSPLTVLGAIAVRDRMKKHLAAAFVKTATADDKIASDVNDNDDNDDEDERQKTFSAASELGGSLAQLGKIAERLCRLVADGRGQMVTVSSDLVESLANRDEQDEVSSLILALVLYQRVFHSHDKGQWTLLSPPPSHGGRFASTDPVFLLKKTLGSGVFDEECVQGLEDARDETVDLIVEIERKRRH